MAGGNELVGLSESLSTVVESAATFTVRVNGRGYYGSTGVAWSGGVIVTADHTLERDDDITVALPDGNAILAMIAGRDPTSDLAILRAECDLPVAKRVREVRVGALALAIGRGTGTDASASLGIISAVGRQQRSRRGINLDGLIRPDVTMYPGFSGGPLVTAAGELIGVNTSRLGGGALTIPAEAVNRIVEQLLAHGRIKRGYLGLTSQPVRLAEGQAALAGQEMALVVIGVEPDSPAVASGMMVGDMLIELDGQPIRDTDDLRTVLSAGTAGQHVTLRVIRGTETREFSVTIGER
ncbi:MAG: S1C family serine protease [Chloroflexota bacterium]|nr:S1C family serine protease [Chloroflexota bacterium]